MFDGKTGCDKPKLRHAVYISGLVRIRYIYAVCVGRCEKTCGLPPFCTVQIVIIIIDKQRN